MVNCVTIALSLLVVGFLSGRMCQCACWVFHLRRIHTQAQCEQFVALFPSQGQQVRIVDASGYSRHWFPTVLPTVGKLSYDALQALACFFSFFANAL